LHESTCILTKTWGFPLYFVVDRRGSGALGALDTQDRIDGGHAIASWIFFAFSLTVVYVAARLVIFLGRQRTFPRARLSRPVSIRAQEALALIALGMSIGAVFNTWSAFVPLGEQPTRLAELLFPYTSVQAARASMVHVQRFVLDVLQFPVYGLLLGGYLFARGRIWPMSVVLCVSHALGISFALVA